MQVPGYGSMSFGAEPRRVARWSMSSATGPFIGEIKRWTTEKVKRFWFWNCEVNVSIFLNMIL